MSSEPFPSEIKWATEVRSATTVLPTTEVHLFGSEHLESFGGGCAAERFGVSNATSGSLHGHHGLFEQKQQDQI